jgi:hypothetical protein
MKSSLQGACVILAFASVATSVSAGSKAPVKISTVPEPVLIEKGRSNQFLNFDFILENQGERELTVHFIEVTVLGKTGETIFQKRLGPNGRSILMVPNRKIAAGQKLLIFNPHFAFDLDLKLDRLRFRFGFDPNRNDLENSKEIVIEPVEYRTKTDLVLPLAGRVFVHDGHDFYSHHRRLDITFPLFAKIGLTANPQRYANDFCLTDAQGLMCRGDGKSNDLWFGFGAAVRAPGAGRIVTAVGDMDDNTRQKPFSHETAFLIKHPESFAGNHVIIDHGNGEFSVLAHLQKGSLCVARGDTVRQGQVVGRMGCSGDCAFPHLHHDIQDGPEIGAAGLPVEYRDFQRVTGSGMVEVKRQAVDSGDILVSK